METKTKTKERKEREREREGYIYIYIERERESSPAMRDARDPECDAKHTVGTKLRQGYSIRKDLEIVINSQCLRIGIRTK